MGADQIKHVPGGTVMHLLDGSPCRCNYATLTGSHCSSSGMAADVTGIPTGPAGPHGPPPVGPPGPHAHPHPGSVAAAQLEAAERLALATDPMVRLQMAGISPEYHAHTHAHTHAHSHTHLHLHPSQQAQQAQAQQEAAAAASGTAGFPLPGECLGLPDADSISVCCVITCNQLHQLLLLRDLTTPSLCQNMTLYLKQSHMYIYCCTQFMVLACVAMNLSRVWLHLFPPSHPPGHTVPKQSLNLPSHGLQRLLFLSHGPEKGHSQSPLFAM
jgi:hypothetical protein